MVQDIFDKGFMEAMNDNDFQVMDVDKYANTEPQFFSHQQLVMMAMKKVIEVSCKELREGGIEEKRDKFNNIMTVYIEDTRKSFIESVKTCEMVMSCDIDETANKNINEIKNKLAEYKSRLLKSQQDNFNLLPVHIRQQQTINGNAVNKDYFDTRNIYYKEFMEYQTEIYRMIFAELTKQTQRLDYYKEAMIIG